MGFCCKDIQLQTPLQTSQVIVTVFSTSWTASDPVTEWPSKDFSRTRCQGQGLNVQGQGLEISPYGVL